MRKICSTALISAVLVLAAEANVGNKLQLFDILDERSNWGGLGLSADVNEYVDNTIQLLVPFMKANGLDPMELPEITEGFSVRPILITYSAYLTIHDGYMTGLGNVARTGDQSVNYFAKMLRVRVKLQFSDLEFVFRYLVRVMNTGLLRARGGVIGSLNRFVVTVDLLMDFNNDEIHLQEFSLTDIGRLRVRLTGNILTDWLINPVIRVFTLIFDNMIMRIVANNIRSAIQDGIDVINIGVKNIIQNLEVYSKMIFIATDSTL
ncbi:uncharacterized protein LOC106138678 [Amyelois transitella]|uniref:uncharacterized protein LOC106138678 n=1 Tax=Amyelois transitella TaxID=680683 RepID=UPI002990453E|nr:uncharacterized protein LOC106138678 [Amyelois transitella]